MRIKNHTLTAYALAFLLLLLAGCGGGGGSSTPAMTSDDDMPMPHTVILPSGVTATAGTAEIAAGESETIGDITFSCPAGGEACMVTVAADGTATSTGGAATAAESQASMDRREAMEMAARTRAEGIAMAIDDTPVAADDDNDADTTTVIMPVTVADDSTVAPVFAGESTMDDTDDDFTKSEMGPAEISPWTGGTYTRTMDMLTETVVMYHDRKANGPWEFATADTDGYYDTADRPGVTGTGATGVLALAPAVTDDTRSLFGDTDFGLTAPHQTIPGVANDPDTDDVDESEVRISGTFNGIAGTFACDGGTACTRATNADGNLATFGGTWTFTPTALLDDDGDVLTGTELTEAIEELMVQGVRPDPDYLIFGYWLQAREDDDGAVTYAYTPFHDGNKPFGDIATTVRGGATYEGAATGLYMKKTFDADGKVTPVGSGQFTATAELTVHFNQTIDDPETTNVDEAGTIPPNLENTVSGSITGFMDAQGNMIDEAWAVNLQKGSIVASGGTFSGSTNVMGMYSGMFYGPGNTAATAHPSSAAGIFDGHFSNGHVRGSFATHKQ